MDPKIWGPHAWFFLNSVALAYPENPNEEQKIQYYNFFKSLSYVLPCKVCRENYKNHFFKNKLKNNLNNKKQINKWLVDIHNSVNKIHKKKQFTYSEFIKLYENMYKNSYKYDSSDIFKNIHFKEGLTNKNKDKNKQKPQFNKFNIYKIIIFVLIIMLL